MRVKVLKTLIAQLPDEAILEVNGRPITYHTLRAITVVPIPRTQKPSKETRA